MPPYQARYFQNVASLRPPLRQSTLIGMPASACLMNRMIGSPVYLLFRMSVILHSDGLTEIYAAMNRPEFELPPKLGYCAPADRAVFFSRYSTGL